MSANLTFCWVPRGRCTNLRTGACAAETSVTRGEPDSSSSPAAGVSGADELSFTSLCELLLRSPQDLDPYPPCTPKALRAMDSILVAATPEEQSESACTPVPAVDRVAGVVGVVWVPLSASARVPVGAAEGYLQAVVVRRAWRRRGIARALMTALFGVRDRAGSARGGRLSSEEATARAQPVAWWRLHTMSAGSVATRAYVKHRLVKETDANRANCTAGTGTAEDAMEEHPSCAPDEGITEQTQPPPPPSSCRRALAPDQLAERVEAKLKDMRAVKTLYEQLGFVERRSLFRYYGGLADAVEMVKTPAGALKSGRS